MVTELHKKELEAMRTQHHESFRRIEEQAREARELADAKETAIKELQRECQAKMNRIAAVERDWTGRLKRTEEEHKRQIEALELDSRAKLSNVGIAMEKMRIAHARTLEVMKKEYEVELRRMQEQLTESTARAEIPAYLTALNRVKADFEEFKEKSNERVAQLTKQRDEALLVLAQRERPGNSRNTPQMMASERVVPQSEAISFDRGNVSQQQTERRGVMSILCIITDMCRARQLDRNRRGRR